MGRCWSSRWRGAGGQWRLHAADPRLPVTTTPASGATISGKTLIGLTFPVAMDTASVESRLTIDPPLAGNWQWGLNGSRTDRVVQFIPLQPLAPGVAYRARLAKGAKATNGRAVGRDTVWQFTVRPPSLLFLRAAPGGLPDIRNLWTANGDGSGARQITNERGRAGVYRRAGRLADRLHDAGDAAGDLALGNQSGRHGPRASRPRATPRSTPAPPGARRET